MSIDSRFGELFRYLFARPKKGLPFGQRLVSIEQSRSPGDDFADPFVAFAVQLQYGPTAAASGLEAVLDNDRLSCCRGLQLHIQRQVRTGTLAALGPLDVKPDAGTLIRVRAELGLIGVALKQTGRQRVASLFVEPMWKHLADFRIGLSCDGGQNQNEQHSGEL